MSTINAQVDGLRTLARILTPWHLMRSGVVSRKSEAEHLAEILRDAAATLQQARDNGAIE